MRDIEWHEAALRDIDSIIDYIFGHNPAAATQLDILIQETAQHLALMPYLGRSGRLPGTREFVVHPNYIIVYEVRRESVRITGVLHSRQRYPL